MNKPASLPSGMQLGQRGGAGDSYGGRAVLLPQSEHPLAAPSSAHISSRPTASSACSRLRPSSNNLVALAAFASSAAPRTSTTCHAGRGARPCLL